MTNEAKNKNNYPIFKYGLGPASATLIILGVLLNNNLFFLVGVITGFIWGYKLQKQEPKFKPFWYALMILLIGLVVSISIHDINKFM